MIATIDSREPEDFGEDVSAHEDIEGIEIYVLETGDLAVGEAIIERKTPEDFVSSIQDKGRVFQQARSLAEDGRQPLILIEGDLSDFHDLSHTGFSPTAVRGAMASIVARTGVPVIPCGDRLTLIDLAVRFGLKTTEETSVAFSHDGFEGSGEVNPIVQMYASIPGVGPGRAETLYEAFPAPVSLSEADEEQLSSLDGFGEKTIRRVIRTMRGENG